MTNKYKLLIVGKNPKRFLDNLISLKISLYDVKLTDKELTIVVDLDDYDKILKLKTSYKIKVIDYYGLVKYENILKKYNVFFICLIIGLVLIKVLSSIIFDIDIEHPKSEIRELVLADLEEFGISKYHFKFSYDEKEKIIKKILHKETDRLEWLEIDSIGTKYVVKVEERIKNDPKIDNTFQHIVAKKDAMILQIQASSGEIKVSKNDYVKKGDILISGFITKDEEIKKKVKAIGTVYGEVWYQAEITLPKVYKEIKYTKNSKKRFQVKFLSHDFLLFDFKPYKTYESSNITLLENRLLPMSFNYSKVGETKEITKRYTGTKGEKEALKLAEKNLKKKLSVNDSIISKKVLKKTEKDSKIIVDIFFKVKEDITDTVNIDNIDITKQEGVKDESSN
ncbi:MAG: sporulation protein YqfD [bacterium]|nr:sporulation protein YqfD [bacterium]